MNKEAIQSFTARIAQASKSELTVILYEMTMIELKEAIAAYEAADLTTYERLLKKAQKCVSELMATLDYRYALSFELLSLYLYVSKCIVTAMMKKAPTSLEGAESVLRTLLVGFEGVSMKDSSGPVMKNSQQLYAGLTYGKGQLNETYIDPGNRNRGFIA